VTDLTTSYLGLSLRSPLIVGSCSISRRVENIEAAEAAGAGALVVKSLFEEQIELEAAELEAQLSRYSDTIWESTSYHPDLTHAGPKEHLHWVEQARKRVSFPLIGSINATKPGSWTEFAQGLQDAGVNALELNIFSVVIDPERSGAELLDTACRIVEQVKSRVTIPVAVKVSPYFSSPGHVARKLVDAGADGLVLFNRYVQPDIDIDQETLEIGMVLSERAEMGHGLRWTGLLSSLVDADICTSTGIHEGEDAIKAILAGARAFQVVSAILERGFSHIRRINESIAGWMAGKDYRKLDDFRGKLSQGKIDDPYAYERAQYIKALLGFD